MARVLFLALASVVCVGLTGASAQNGRTGGQGRISLLTIARIEDRRAPTRGDLDVLISALRGPLADRAALALGRLQRRDVIRDLLPLLSSDDTRASAATALALALRGPALDGVPHGQQEQAVLSALVAAGDSQLRTPRPKGLSAIAMALGRLPHEDVDSFTSAEIFLRRVLEQPFPLLDDAPHIEAARGLEALARLRRKIAALDAVTIARLRSMAQTIDPKRADHRRNALAALVAAQAVDPTTLDAVIDGGDPETRRLAMLSLVGAGSLVDDERRLGYIRKALSDTSFMVRLEAVRAWARRAAPEHGCMPLLDAAIDRNLHVALAAIDALGDVCRDDETVTVRLASDVRTPNPSRWHREAHAFVALAKRDPQRASVHLFAFAAHNTWQVRMYAARAAAILEDVAILTRLAQDPDNNVAEAALVPLRRLAGTESDAVFVQALARRTRPGINGQTNKPYQIVRTAALALEKATPTAELVTALGRALEQISEEQCETSRDTRIALIERLSALGGPEQARFLVPLLRDVDPVVAAAASSLLTAWTGRPAPAQPATEQPQAIVEPATRESAVFEMDNGRRFEIDFDPDAPLARSRVLAAMRAGYYNNLTFHRVVPNFVIQGGSPGANEYCGACPFMRDELGGMHRRGTMGISTRGPNTGDAQIFVNLVDNARLDLDYTVFARVCAGMDVVDDIQEGDRISRVEILKTTRACENAEPSRPY